MRHILGLCLITSANSRRKAIRKELRIRFVSHQSPLPFLSYRCSRSDVGPIYYHAYYWAYSVIIIETIKICHV